MKWIPSFLLTPERVERFLKNARKNFSSIAHPSIIALHVEDPNAHKIGAPQNVELLHRLLKACPLPVHFAGGVSTVHITELLLTLGVSKVVIEAASFLKNKRERAAHFVQRFGESCVPRVLQGDFSNEESLFEVMSMLKHVGFSRIIFKLEDKNSLGRTMKCISDAWASFWWLETPFTNDSECNAELLSRVGIEATVAPVERFLTVRKRN